MPGTYTSTTGSMTVQLTSDSSVVGSGIILAWSVSACPVPCNPGFTGPTGGTCTACAAGKYKTASGPAACTDCASGKYSTTTAATLESACTACPGNSNSPTASNAVTACTCNPGFTGPNGGPCTACVTGKYKIASGPAACTDCAAGTYSTTVGATIATTCVACPANSNSPIASVALTACICYAGFSGPDGGPCTTCVAGKYKTTSGSACTDCAAGTYRTAANAASCTTTIQRSCGVSATDTCSASQSSTLSNDGAAWGAARGIDQNMGTIFHTDGNTGAWWMLDFGRSVMVTKFIMYNRQDCCWDRIANYKITVGDSSSVNINAVCVSNMPAPLLSPYMTDAMCTTTLRGRYLHFSIGGGNLHFAELQVTGCWDGGVCEACPAGTTSPIASTSSAACISPDCNSGYTGPSGGPCTACVAGKYKIASGSAACTDCGAGTYSTTVGATIATTCIACPGNSNSPIASTSVAACTCNAGSTGPDGGLTLTTDSTNLVAWYKLNGDLTDSTGRTGSLINAGGTLAFAQDATLNSNLPYSWYAVGSGTSNLNYARSPVINRNVPLSFAFWFKTTGSGGYTILSYGDKSVENPSIQFDYNGGQLSVATALSTQWTTVPLTTGLVVNTWYFVVYTLSNANPVSTILYIDGTQRATGTGSTGQTLPRFKDLTVANSGDTGRGFAGHIGDIRIYDKVLIQAEITSLFTNMPTPCTTCVAGKYKIVSGSAACTDCATGTYSTTVGATIATTCIACPANSNSPSPSSVATACTCNVGYTGPDGGACSPCAVGKYKIVSGSAACTDCGAGTYSTTVGATIATTCIACPANSNSPSPSTTVTACTCNAGSTGPDGGPCVSCVAGKYKSATGSAECTNCGSGTYSATIGATAVAACLACPANSGASCVGCSASTGCTCNGGFTGPDGGVCSACDPGTYQTLQCQDDPAFEYINGFPCSEYAPGGSGEGYCVESSNDFQTCSYCCASCATECPGGGSGISMSVCSPCEKGTFADTIGATACSPCSAGKFADGPGAMTCSSCDAGTYESATGSAECTACGVGTYSTTVGATVATTCLTCPISSDSPVKSSALTACTCNVGYTGPDGGVCSTCAAGKYKSVTGSATCTDCGVGTYSTTVGATVATTCLTCPTSSDSPVTSTALTACTCNVGYTGPDGGVCSTCAAGKYKSVTGSATCTDCGVGTYSATVGATVATTCLTCPANSGASCTGCSASTGCTCNAGYTGPDGGVCSNCVAGKYKISSGSAACTNCGSGTYSETIAATGLMTCLACPTNSGSTCSGCSAMISCRCNIGYTGPSGSSCSPCAAGTYKILTGAGACISCASGKYSTTSAATTSTTCLSCPTNSGGSCFGCSSLTSCKCSPGFYGPDGGVCTACPSNSGTSCIGCNTLDGCTCDIGFTGPNGGACTVCATGTYKNIPGDVTCSACPANSGSSCSGCYTSACPCNAGYTGGNFIAPHSLTACGRFVALITWKPSFASVATRNDAALGSSSLPTYDALGGPNGKGHVSFVRTQLQYLEFGPRSFNIRTNGGFTMVVVMRFTGTALSGERIFAMWSAGLHEITVSRFTSAGHILFDICNYGQNCMSYNTDNSIAQNVWGTLTITYSTTTFLLNMKLNGVGVPQNIGSGWDDKTLLGMQIGKQWTVTTLNLNADIAGFFLVDEWLSTAATTEIANAITQGLDMTDTTCPSGNACTACAVGTYKNSSGSTACTACPADMTSPLGSTSSDACVYPPCNAGYTGPDGICSTCAAGTYKVGIGSAACTPCVTGKYSTMPAATAETACLSCPANSNSPSQSSATTACTCNAGYSGPDGGLCTACAAGKYKSFTGSATCTSCPVFSGAVCATCSSTWF